MRAVVAVVVLAIVVVGSRASAQDLGHRLVGTQGLSAGRALSPGLYVADQLIYYSAETLRDREGNEVPIDGLDISAIGNGLGVAFVVEIPEIAAFVSVTAAGTIAHLSTSADRADLNTERYGLGDVFLQPLRIGWRADQLDVICSYSLYVPTGRFELGARVSGVSSGHYAHEWSVGATVFADAERRYYASAIASYGLQHQKIDIDITRGDSVQIQGGIGANLFGLVDVGPVGGALWQIEDDSGADVPPVLRGARDRVFLLGGEIGVTLAAIRGRISARYEHELEARSRPEGQILVFQLSLAAWQPEAPQGAQAPAPDAPLAIGIQ